MAEPTLHHLDKKLDTLIGEVRQGFAEHRQRIDTIEQQLTQLITTVDRFAKIYTDLNQELVFLRQHVRDVETRMDKLELKLQETGAR